MAKKKGLDARQERFCVEYAKSGNIYQSALAAGYSKGYAVGKIKYLLENDRVQDRLRELMDDYKNSKIADIKEMQETLTAIIRQYMTEEQIVVEGKGDGITEARKVDKKPALKEVVKAIETLGRMQGAFSENINLNSKVVIIDDCNQ